MDEEQQFDDFFLTLWRTLVMLKRVCVQLRLPQHAKQVGKILDDLEKMRGDDDGTEDDAIQEEASSARDELAGRADVPRGKPSR